jgi:3-deoxy-7-phosphoheptulonate synthase
MEKMLNKKVTKIGRIAGQYAKPRSSPTEVIDGFTINSYFGDNVNKFEPTKEGRIPDPKRLLKGYHWAVTTYHTLKLKEEEKDIHETLTQVLEQKYRDADTIDRESDEYINFITTLKECINDDKIIEDTFISHEGLILDYESQMTRLLEPSDIYKKVSVFEYHFWCICHQI